MSNLSARLKSANPYATGQEWDDHAEETLQRLMRSTPAPGRPEQPAQRRQKTKGVAAIAGIGALVVGGGTIFAVLPAAAEPLPPTPVDAPASGTTTEHIVAQIVAQIADQPSVPSVRQAQWSGWYLHTTVNHRKTSNAIVPKEYSVNWTQDFAGERSVKDGAPWVANTSLVGRILAPLPSLPDRSEQHSTYPPGQYRVAFRTAPPTTASAWREYLQRGTNSAQDNDGWYVSALSEVHLEWTPGTAARVAMVQSLAQLDSVRYAGTAKDRKGRLGHAFVVHHANHGLAKSSTLLISPTTGRLLAVEDVFTGDTGALQLKSPAVESYEVFGNGD